MKKLQYSLFLAFICLFSTLQAQENLSYQSPPQSILDLVDVDLPPNTYMDSKKNYMLLLSRAQYKSIEELSQEEMRLAGLRIDPKTNIGSRTNYFNNIQIKNLRKKKAKVQQIEGLPQKPRLSNFSWSPDQSKMAFTHTASQGVELWVMDMKTSKAKKLTEASINANLRYTVNWFEDGKALLVKMLPEKRKELIDASASIPKGPTISVNEGKKAQNRTYQDLLKNPNDEYNFEALATSQLVKIGIDGTQQVWKEAAMFNMVEFSPDGNYVMVSTVQKPFSYLVPYRRFPSKTEVYSKEGKLVKVLNEVPLIEDLPKGFMSVRTGPRSMDWRDDKPASITFAQALDGGDANVESEYRDEVFQWDAPFATEPVSLLKIKNRYSYIDWGNDNIAIAHDYWWNTRNTKSYIFNPSDNTQAPSTLVDRSYQDRYSDPGNFVSERNEFGSYVLSMKDGYAFLLGAGYTEKGQFPFLNKLHLATNKTETVYRSAYDDRVERLSDYDLAENRLLVRIQSPSQYPNYSFRNLDNNTLTAITKYKNPYTSIQNVKKELLEYKRDDDISLTGTLYYPLDYKEGEKYPMILWAYPREFKDKSSASQNTQNPNEFTFPYWGSPIYWVTRGYVVLDDASFPIIGEGDEEPNDSFRSQLVANAKAAIDAVDKKGIIDRNRVAVGGHSYGAFMVANLLSHSDLFAAGIARSGAYNRTLTPFGFQSEERNYWEAPEVYYTMSPFMHAEKMKTPLLLIHGEADNNSGTYPMQSERYFNALKGLGANVRLVMLPKESHGYRAKESIFHMLWEQDQWLEKHCKNRKAQTEDKP